MVTPINGTKIAGLQQSFALKGMGKVLVVEPGRLQSLTGIDSLKRLPNLHQKLTDLIRTKFGIEVSEIVCDREAKLEILGCNPPFLERVRNANGNLDILGHTVVFEMENENRGKLYLLNNENNVASIMDRKNLGQPSPILTDDAGRVIVPVSTFEPEGKPVTMKYQLDILLDPVQFRNILPLDPAKRLKVTASILGELKNLAEKLPAARKTGHILTEMDIIIASSKNDPDFINAAITIGLEMIADTENKGINWAGATLLSKIRIPTDHPKLNDIYLSFIAALGRWSGSGSETEIILKNVFSSMPAPQPIPPLSIKIINPAESEMNGKLNMIRNARSILAEAQGEKYSVELDYRDSAEIRETTSALRSLLDELGRYTAGNPIMRMKVDELKERIDRDLEINNLWPWRYAAEAGGILGFIDEIRQITG